MSPSLTGKHIIVTGATNGIGEIAALELARMGATVVVMSRSADRCKATVERITSETGNANVSYIAADLSSIAATREAAATYRQQFDRLDVLLNNAGAFFNERKTSVDGIEMTVALNHLSYFIMAEELLDMLKATAASEGEARIVNVSSAAHQSGMNWDDLQYEKRWSGWGAYGQSKHMNILFSYELARRLDGTGVTVNALHPGFVNTGFGMNNGGIMKAILGFFQNIAAKNPQDGASTSIYLASSPDVKGVTGKYWADSKALKSNAATYDTGKWERLWTYTEQLLAEKGAR